MKSIGKVECTYTGEDGKAHSLVTWKSPQVASELEKVIGQESLIEVKDIGKNRSLQQNSLLWELIGRIAKNENAPHHDPVEMYGEILKTAKAKCAYIKVMEDAIPALKRQNGVRFLEPLSYETNRKGVKWANCRLYLGSSGMNTKEMNQVIDAAKWWATNLGVPWGDIL